MESVTGYLLERGAFGTRAVLTSDWGAETERSLLKQPIAERCISWKRHASIRPKRCSCF
jgi:hypothetical protein